MLKKITNKSQLVKNINKKAGQLRCLQTCRYVYTYRRESAGVCVCVSVGLQAIKLFKKSILFQL